MKGLKQLLVKEKERLEDIIKISTKRLKDVPEGSLRLSKTKKYVQYYHCTNENKFGKYIPKGKEELVRKLIQKSYDEKVLRLAEKRLKQVNKLAKDYEEDEIEEIFYHEHPERRKYIQTVQPTWEEKLKKWKSEEYQSKEFKENIPVILTERGERVRSKSEKIIADYFFRHGIEYKYECPLYIKGMGTIYPDFTFLSRKTGEEIYWEHNGMADSPEYARKMVRKIESYENNGIFSGERLILTFETQQSVINTKKIEQLVNRYLK